MDSTTNVARLQSFGLDAIAERRRPVILKKWDAITNFVEENRQHIFYIFVFYVITIASFIERFICKLFIDNLLPRDNFSCKRCVYAPKIPILAEFSMQK